MFGHNRKLLLSLLIVGVVAIATSWSAVRQAENSHLREDALDSALKWATFVQDNLSDLDELLGGDPILASDLRVFEFAGKAGNVFRYKVFGPDGRIVFASRASDVGKTNTKPYFSDLVTKGHTFVKIEEEEEFGGGRTIVSEAYVPIMDHDRFKGAIEVYVDMTAPAVAHREAGNLALMGLLTLLGVIGAVCGLFVWQDIRDHERELREVTESRERIITVGIALREAHETLEQRTAALETEITERKHAEEALRESEKRLRDAASLAKLGHWIWDSVADKCLYVSEEHARMHGVTPEAYVARASTLDREMSFIHPDDHEEYGITVAGLRAGKTYDIEYRRLTANGETRYVREIGRPVFDDGGKVTHEHGIMQDITEQKQLENRLREAQKLDVLGQLTGGVAHEFNNLLQSIVGGLDVISNEVRGMDRATRMIELAQRSAFRGKELTGRLLSYVGKYPMKPEVINVGEFVRDAVDLFEPMLGETIEIEAEIADDLWPIKVDREQLETAAWNLAINAKDAMADGGRLTIEAANVHIDEVFVAKRPYSVTPGDYVKLAVTDTGTGISQEVRDQVFDPFFTTKEVGKGAGLGLSMVYGFVQRQSGGGVDITSDVGRGTTVALYLPRADAEKAEASQPAEGSKEPSTGAGTILVVEDEPAVLDTMALMLEGLGYTVLKAKDGAEALTVLEQAGVIDLLLADVILPGGTSGIELADTVRRANPATNVIVMSGYPEDKFDTTAISKARIRILKKPFA
ncbi:MAG: response regulator [Proteobacteria bacterium]|nr:response regulator [Pseudomonadota bacterium]